MKRWSLSSQVAIRFGVGGLTLILTFLIFATSVAAEDEEFEIVIPLATAVRAPEGSEVILSVTPTPDGLAGETCAVTAVATNQSSVHPGNDLVVEGATQIILSDVEAVPGGVVTATDTIVLSEEIVVTLIMGPDEVFSAGLEVMFDCPPTTTTTATSTTTTIVATTVTTEETTTSAAPTSTTSSPTTSMAPPTSPSTTVSPPTSIPDEVKGTEVLPFTGTADSGLGLLALAIAACGALLLVWARTIELPMLSIYFTWDPSCARCGADALFSTPHGMLCSADTRRALDEDHELWMPERIDRLPNARPDTK